MKLDTNANIKLNFGVGYLELCRIASFVQLYRIYQVLLDVLSKHVADRWYLNSVNTMPSDYRNAPHCAYVIIYTNNEWLQRHFELYSGGHVWISTFIWIKPRE